MVLDWLSQMTTTEYKIKVINEITTATKFKIKVINETILNDISKSEAEQIAEILEMRNTIPTFLGNVSYTYSEIEQMN